MTRRPVPPPDFPDPRRANRIGLLAVGGDLSPDRLLLAYRSGIFPMWDDEITWWSPNPRAIFELDAFHIPRRLERLLRQRPFEVTRDRAFQRVVESCADPEVHDAGDWIGPGFAEAYTRLHELGYAHSVECWRDGELVGGVYGVALGGFFSGESMFHRADNASKVALCRLVEHLRAGGFALFDIQMVTPATEPFRPRMISRGDYLDRLAAALRLEARFEPAG